MKSWQNQLVYSLTPLANISIKVLKLLIPMECTFILFLHCHEQKLCFRKFRKKMELILFSRWPAPWQWGQMGVEIFCHTEATNFFCSKNFRHFCVRGKVLLVRRVLKLYIGRQMFLRALYIFKGFVNIDIFTRFTVRIFFSE